MTFSIGIIALLFLGLILTRPWPWIERRGTVIGPVVIALALGSEVVLRWIHGGNSPEARLLGVLAVLGGLAWAITLRDQTRAALWGAVAWSLAGLLLLDQSADLVVIGLGWELLRQGVRQLVSDDEASRDRSTELLLSAAWWLAVAGCLLFAGSTDLTVIMHVARLQYWPAGPLDTMARASLLFVATVALLVLSVVGALTMPAHRTEAHDVSSRRRAACGLLHLQWGAVWILATLFRTGTPGVTATMTVLLTVLILAAWVSTIRTLGRVECWSDLIEGAVRYHGGWLLCITWVLLVPVHGPPLLEGGLHSPMANPYAWSQELLHGGVCLTACLAALSWSARSGNSTDYLEACRGAGASYRWSVLFVLVPLASLIGFPGVWGSWSRLISVTTFLSVHSMREDELAVPIGSAVVIVLGGVMATGYLIRVVVKVVSILCWEPLLGRLRSPGDGWPQVVAGVLSVVLVSAGIVPGAIRLVLDWLHTVR